MSRNRILKRVSTKKPDKIEIPKHMVSSSNEHVDLTKKFIDFAIRAGSDIEEFDSFEQVMDWIHQQKRIGKTVFDLTRKSEKYTEQILTTHDFSNSDLVVLRGQLGVAENGAVWINDKDMGIRKLPFITSHLVLILEKKNILVDMHQAYDQIDLNHTGFGVFIAGPSKTADIEQSLVIGAHGPIKQTILLFPEFRTGT